MGAWEDGFAAGYRAAWERAVISSGQGIELIRPPRGGPGVRAPARPKRKASAYSKRYGAAFKRLQKKYKTKSGAWRKGGFKACQKAAHKAARK